MKINNKEVKTNGYFAYDNCHKIYILEDDEDMQMARQYGYDIFDIKAIEDKYYNSCPLRFIENWKLNTYYAEQCENTTFED